jgi:hypothetical protein
MYLYNFTEKGYECDVTLFKSSNGGGSWSYVTTEPVETPVYNFAYTKMVGDAGANDLVRGRISCFHGTNSYSFSPWATEIPS